MYERLMRVSRGFRFVYYGLVLFVLAFLGGVIGVFVIAGALAGGGKGAGTLAGVFAIGMLLCVLGASITGLIGRYFCLAVPARAGSAKPLIFASVAAEVVAMTLGSLNQIDNAKLVTFGPALTETLRTGWVLLSVVSAVLFLLFSKAAATYIREDELAEKAASVLWLWAAMVGCYILGTVITLAVVRTGPGGGAFGGMCFVLILLVAALILALKALFRYVGLARDMSEALEDFARRARRAERNKRKRKQREREEAEDDEE